MDRRLYAFLLSVALGTPTLLATPAGAADDPVGVQSENPQVVEPRVKRRDVSVPSIDTENFETGLYIGTISIEDFGSSLLYGGRIAYHFTEDVFAEASLGSAKAGKTSYEDLSGSAQLLTNSERQYTYYDLSIGWNALPGEVFLGGKRAMPSALYLSLGAGNTHFGGDDHFTVTFGTGFRLLVTDWLAAHLDARDQAFDSDLLGKNKLTHNVQLALGVTAFF
jgi:outer membrane beta-barrel protein